MAKLNGRDLNGQYPLALLGSGASSTVAGRKWTHRRNQPPMPLSKDESINLRFGDGSGSPSQGSCVVKITPPPECANRSANHVLDLEVRISQEGAPLLISRETLERLGAMLDFNDTSLWVRNQLRTQLIETPSCHLMLAGTRFEGKQPHPERIFGNRVYSATLEVPATVLTKSELRRSHLQTSQ